MKSWHIGLCLLAVGLVSVRLEAQTFRGAIVGTVTDKSEAVIPGAKVTAKNLATGFARSTVTDDAGDFHLPELPIGDYSVTIEKEGFQTATLAKLTIGVASEQRTDVTLQPGRVEAVVEVTEGAPLLQTTMNTLGGVIEAQQTENLPINGRDYTKLIYLAPGVAGSPDQISDSPGSFGEFSMNGARGRSNNYLLDGTDMNDGYRNDPAINQAGVFGTPSAILPIDAVAEVRVLSNFEPEYGRNAGAVVNIVTKSGTNSVHGTAADYFRNDALDARNFFNPGSQPKASFHNQQYGGSLGGPIVKDKTFFYGDYEGQQETVGVVTLGCVPVGTAADGSLSPSQASNLVIASLLARHPWPAPNLGAGTSCPNSSVISPSFNELSSAIAKIDHSFDEKNILTGRYFFGDSVQSFPLALTASGGQLPGFNTNTPTRAQLVSLSYLHTFGATKVNELRFGWNRFAEGFFPQDQGFHPSSIHLCDSSTSAGCSGSGFSDSGLPIILVSGVAQLGATSSVPRHRVDSNSQVIDNFSWKLTRHEVKLGFNFHRTTIQQYFAKYFRGRLKFTGHKVSATVSTTALQDFLSGYVDSGFQYFGDSTRHTFENNLGFYAQDSYRVTPRLTLNYGMRWDYFGVVGEKKNLLSNITSIAPAPGTGTFTLTQVGQPGLSSLYQPDHKDFAPRVNAIWDVTGQRKTVVRAGFGLFFDAFSQDMVLGHLPYAPFFDPGPAYNNIGSAAILSTGAVGGTIALDSPVYAATTTCSFECDAFAFDRNIKMPYMENYNVNLQQQIANNVMLEVGYVGSQGHRLWRFFDLSQPSTAEINNCDLGIPPGGSSCGTFQDFGSGARPLAANPYNAYYVLQENSTGRSSYNSLQVSLRVNGWHGITSIANYVWSRSLDNSSDGEDFEPNTAQPNDSTRPELEYGPSNFNVPHRFTWIFGYSLPRREGNWKRLKNGWGVNSSVTLQSGQPFQFNENFWDDYSGSGNAFDRPDVVGPIVYHPHDPSNYVELSSFAIPCTITPTAQAAPSGAASDCVPGTRHFGNLGRDALHGPTFKQWDFAIYKNTPVTERLTAQLRADIFNILNHPNFANPFLPAFLADPFVNGWAASGNHEVGVRGYPITATGDVGIGNPFLGGGGPRGIQLAVKFTF